MLFKVSVLTGFVLSAALFARADVTPSDPGPGSLYNAGQTCTVSWVGDTTSTTAWKSMAIELMTGSNFAMVHLTTVATNQDGTVAGRVNYPCPDVTPHSNIYFYQFTSSGASDKQWTTRFTIASPTGQTVSPTNATQPGTGDPIPWGTGALVDPSSATPPPASAQDSTYGATGSNNTVSVSAASSIVSASVDAPQSAASRIATSTLASGSAAPTGNANATAAGAVAGSGARADSVVWGSMLVAAFSTIAFALSI